MAIHDEQETMMNRFFRQYFGPFIVKPYTAVGATLLLGVYLAGAIYGTWHLREGLHPSRLVHDSVKFFKILIF
jgi:hypothetical protein